MKNVFYCPQCKKLEINFEFDEKKDRNKITYMNPRDGYGRPITHIICPSCGYELSGFVNTMGQVKQKEDEISIPADITLLRKAKDCLKQGIKQLEKYINRFEQTPEEAVCIEMHETALEIDMGMDFYSCVDENKNVKSRNIVDNIAYVDFKSNKVKI